MTKRITWFFSRAYQKFNNDRCPLLASALVHATTFSLFPLILGLLSFSLFILGSSEEFLNKILPFLKQVFPVGIDEIIKNISAIKQTSIVIAIIGVIGFLWGAASIFRALESTLNVIWKVKKDRPFFRKSLLTIGSAFLVFILLIASVAVTIWINAIGAGGLTQYIREFSILFSIILFGLIYWRFPNRKIKVKEAFVGAVFTGIFWEAAKHLFTFYITRVVDYSKIFGSLSAIIILFLWIYYSAYIFLFGAELCYVYARRKILK
ncbi:MAG TPA: YihY/virulence factor BrkB family protein [candidate division WOR-3 bacterium]|uniref:YihY/virulence factor BrkB family protein n=1 Tax=candidate division WOR-3 bacterium TaxID=2052148 RepID=A0A9C9EMY5_UNCW3|nr:YihY/virulence factor BrkB family protein [candidate division WOR-3 bacterium]